MNIGSYLDKIVMVVFGGWLVYASRKNKERWGEKKTKWLMIAGGAIILSQIALLFFQSK